MDSSVNIWLKERNIVLEESFTESLSEYAKKYQKK